MEHDSPLYQGDVRLLSESLLVAEVVNIMCLQLRPLAPLDRLAFHLRLCATLDEISDS